MTTAVQMPLLGTQDNVWRAVTIRSVLLPLCWQNESQNYIVVAISLGLLCTAVTSQLCAIWGIFLCDVVYTASFSPKVATTGTTWTGQLSCVLSDPFFQAQGRLMKLRRRQWVSACGKLVRNSQHFCFPAAQRGRWTMGDWHLERMNFTLKSTAIKWPSQDMDPGEWLLILLFQGTDLFPAKGNTSFLPGKLTPRSPEWALKWWSPFKSTCKQSSGFLGGRLKGQPGFHPIGKVLGV
jgi:hypothetical protein